MTDLAEYAIVDVTEGSVSEGKILVLLDDETTANEMAAEMSRRGGSVVVKYHPCLPQPVTSPAGARSGARSANSRGLKHVS
jgi:hypothetical protein